jgi:hypothetical protein
MSVPSPAVMLIEDPGGFLRAAAPADATFRWMLAAIDEVAIKTASRRALRLLFDLSAIVPAPSVVAQTILGEHVARQLGHAEKVASLVAEGTRTGLSERVAQGLGLRLRVFTSETEAVDWLRS